MISRGWQARLPLPTPRVECSAHSSISTAGGDGYFKMCDDNNPCVCDRVFFDYNGFKSCCWAPTARCTT